MNRLKAFLRQPEFSLLFFFFCLALLGWPYFVGIMSTPDLFLYFFAVWAGIIVCLFLVSRAYVKDRPDKPDSQDGGRC